MNVYFILFKYKQAATFWSVGGFRQQFSLPENINMSMYGIDFLKNAKTALKCADHGKK